MLHTLRVGWVGASLGMMVLAAPVAVFAADDARPEVPGKPATPARPQTPGRPGNVDMIGKLKGVVEDLKLTGETKTKVDGILAKAKEDVEKAQKEAGDDRRAALGKMMELTRSASEDISAALDEDQKLMFQTKLRAALAAGPGAGAGGQPGGRPAQMGQRIKDAVAPLGLSEEQTKKVDGVIEDLQKKADEIRNAGGADMREKFQALRDDGLAQMKAILTEEQLGKFVEAMQQPPAGGPGGGRLAGVLQQLQDGMKDLGLTEGQKTKADAAFADAKAKLKELGPQLAGGQPTPEAREKLRGTFEELRTQLVGLLNEEQKEKFRTLMQNAGPGARRPPGEKPADK